MRTFHIITFVSNKKHIRINVIFITLRIESIIVTNSFRCFLMNGDMNYNKQNDYDTLR